MVHEENQMDIYIFFKYTQGKQGCFVEKETFRNKNQKFLPEQLKAGADYTMLPPSGGNLKLNGRFSKLLAPKAKIVDHHCYK